MADGAVIATAGSAPRAALFDDLPPMGPTRADSDLVQARYELHRALDTGVEADRAAWCERWGEALLDRLTPARRDDYVSQVSNISSRVALRERMPKKRKPK